MVRALAGSMESCLPQSESRHKAGDGHQIRPDLGMLCPGPGYFCNRSVRELGIPMSPLACRPGISIPAVSKSVSRVLTKITHMTRFIPGLSRDARHQKIGFCEVETYLPIALSSQGESRADLTSSPISITSN